MSVNDSNTTVIFDYFGLINSIKVDSSSLLLDFYMIDDEQCKEGYHM